MAKAKKQTARGRKQDRARVAGGQKYEVSYEAKKTGRSASAVKKAVKKVGSSRKRVFLWRTPQFPGLPILPDLGRNTQAGAGI